MCCSVPLAWKERERRRTHVRCRTRVQWACVRQNETANYRLTLHPAGERIHVNRHRSEPRSGQMLLTSRKLRTTWALPKKQSRRTCEPMMLFSTTIVSSTGVFGKRSLSQITVDRHLAVNSKKESGMPAVIDGPRLVDDGVGLWALCGVLGAWV